MTFVWKVTGLVITVKTVVSVVYTENYVRNIAAPVIANLVTLTCILFSFYVQCIYFFILLYYFLDIFFVDCNIHLNSYWVKQNKGLNAV